MGAGDREAEGQLVVDGGLGQAAVLEVVGVVEHIVGDHVAQLPLIAVGVDPVGNGPDLANVLPVVDQAVLLVQLPGGLKGDQRVVDEIPRQGQGGHGRAAHAHGKHQHKDPAPQLEVPAVLDALGQSGGTQQKEDEVPRQEEQELMGAGVLHPGKEQQAHQHLPCCQPEQKALLPPAGQPEAHAHEDQVEQPQPVQVQG